VDKKVENVIILPNVEVDRKSLSPDKVLTPLTERSVLCVLSPALVYSHVIILIFFFLFITVCITRPDAAQVYIQLAAVYPYFDPAESEFRTTAFERNFNTRTFSLSLSLLLSLLPPR
jgi:hypothetical protein